MLYASEFFVVVFVMGRCLFLPYQRSPMGQSPQSCTSSFTGHLPPDVFPVMSSSTCFLHFSSYFSKNLSSSISAHLPTPPLRLWASRSSWRYPCLFQGGWARWPFFNGPFHKKYSMILWSYNYMYSFCSFFLLIFGLWIFWGKGFPVWR